MARAQLEGLGMLQDQDVGALENCEEIRDPAQRIRCLRRAAGLEVTLSIPRDPQAIAEVLGALVRADLRRGARVPGEVLRRLRYRRERKKDRWDAPEVVAYRGSDDCDGLARAAATERGAFVACVAAPGGGWHVFLQDEDGRVDDPCVAAGMRAPAPEAYRGAARDRIRPERLGHAAPRVAQAERRPPIQHDASLARALYGVLRQLPERQAEQIRAELPDPGVEGVGEVEGIFGTIVAAAGAVAAGVVSVAATPAAGAGVAVATAAAAAVVNEAEKKAEQKKKPPKKHAKTQRKDPEQIREEAKEIAATAPPGSEQQRAALALLYVLDPRARQRLAARLRLPAGQDPRLQDRARLLAAIATLEAAGYHVPTVAAPGTQAPPAPPTAPAPPPPPAPPAPAPAPAAPPPPEEYEEEDLEELEELDPEELEELLSELAWQGGFQADCPGTCAVR